MDKNQQAKREVIATFFDKAEVRVAFLSELAQTGHKPEAMTLCLTYIDSFAQWLCWSAASSGRNLVGRNFVEAVIQFGGEPLMGLVDLHLLKDARKALGKDLAEQIDRTFPGPPHELLPRPTFVDALAGHLENAQLEKLQQEVWRLTIAKVVYQYLRNPAVHDFGTSDGIWLSQLTYKGSSVPPLGFCQLLRCVHGLVAEARRRSEANGQWFGNDAIVKDS